ncbi:hypothetical protein PRK78_005487 [Emydomyces testavorans]|uniref:Large ribosomal subunit protein bL21m n=1 Tax=Emydomyces testavorans TaxID=2070801 RepID=A0AAF0DNI5_9EURO|nr:hypothetical protein PRK78_005487 [Emydomyces testavorans]
MLSRLPSRLALDLRVLPSSTFAFQQQQRQRAHLHQAPSATQFRETHPEIPPQTPRPLSPSLRQPNARQHPPPAPSPPSSSLPPLRQTTLPTPKPAVPPTFTTPLTLTPSILSLLPHLTTQTPHYITAHIHARPYLLTAGDTVRLPFLMPSVQPGDILRLNRASVLGSRDFTLKGAPYVDERLFECRVRVLGVEAEPMRIKEKTKRRQRHIQRVKSKHKYTILRVMEVKVKTVEELMAEGAEMERK